MNVMNEFSVTDFAFHMRKAKKDGDSLPVFFLGEGFSRSGLMPLAKKVAEEVAEKYAHLPAVKALKESDKMILPKVLEAVGFERRNEALGNFPKAAVAYNAAHLYLASLYKQDYVDHVLSVNNDPMLSRSFEAFNIPDGVYRREQYNYPYVPFDHKSAFLIHGRHKDVWHDRPEDEIRMIEERIPAILQGVKGRQPWIFIDYSGSDEIFNFITKLGQFEGGIYWVTYKDEPLPENVIHFLESQNVPVKLIRGYTADTFMMHLHEELCIEPLDERDAYSLGVATFLAAINEKTSDTNEYMEAIQYFKKAFGPVSVDRGFVLRRWGMAVIEIAKIIGCDATQGLLDELHAVYEGFTSAIGNNPHLNPQSNYLFGLFDDWSLFMVYVARIQEANDKERGYKEVVEKFAPYGFNALYGLACAYAFLRRYDQALVTLEGSFKYAQKDLDRVNQDPEWDSLRDHPDFQALLAKYKD